MLSSSIVCDHSSTGSAETNCGNDTSIGEMSA